MPNKKEKIIIDSDKDGLSDYEERNIYGTDPYNPDTDGDGMSDGDEVRNNRNPKGPGKLKDLFIPHKGNNFKPHSLHLERLFFHGAAAVIIKLAVIGFVVLFPIEAWLTPDIQYEESRKIIELTNNIREDLNLGLLKENSLLTQAAYSKAEDMLINQYFSHFGPDGKGLADWLKYVGYNYIVAGENLAMGFSSSEDVVNGWTKSQTHYANMVDPEFSEIGVGMSSGDYNDKDTTFVAQYFGAQNKFVKASSDNSSTRNSIEGNSYIASKNEEAVNGYNAIDSTPPEANLEKTKVYISKADNQKTSLIRVEAFISSDAKEAQVNLDNYKIPLAQDMDNQNKWVGQIVAYDKNIYNPIILPNLTMTDHAGNTAVTDIAWDNIEPIQPSLLSQYFFARSHQSKYVQLIFSLSSWYFKIILGILSISLILNIFIEIRKQHPHIILSTVSLIGLLLILLVF